MTEKPFDVAHLDELEPLSVQDGKLQWRPIRRHFDIQAFGAGIWSGDAGGELIEDHYERDGHEELYVVMRGRATFSLGDGEEVDAPAGTLVFVRPGNRRHAVAREDGTVVLAVGAKAGEVFEPSGWEWAAIAFSKLRAGRVEEGRKVMLEGVTANEGHWAAHFNLACFEILSGRPEKSLAALRRSVELNPEQARKFAAEDSDFEPLRADPRFQELVGA